MLDRQGNRAVFECDGCGETEEGRGVYGRDDFTFFWEELRDQGWIAYAVGKDWQHWCPDCNRKQTKTRMAKTDVRRNVMKITIEMSEDERRFLTVQFDAKEAALSCAFNHDFLASKNRHFLKERAKLYKRLANHLREGGK